MRKTLAARLGWVQLGYDILRPFRLRNHICRVRARNYTSQFLDKSHRSGLFCRDTRDSTYDSG